MPDYWTLLGWVGVLVPRGTAFVDKRKPFHSISSLCTSLDKQSNAFNSHALHTPCRRSRWRPNQYWVGCGAPPRATWCPSPTMPPSSERRCRSKCRSRYLCSERAAEISRRPTAERCPQPGVHTSPKQPWWCKMLQAEHLHGFQDCSAAQLWCDYWQVVRFSSWFVCPTPHSAALQRGASESMRHGINH
jgi:hypothetical protein